MYTKDENRMCFVTANTVQSGKNISILIKIETKMCRNEIYPSPLCKHFMGSCTHVEYLFFLIDIGFHWHCCHWDSVTLHRKETQKDAADKGVEQENELANNPIWLYCSFLGRFASISICSCGWSAISAAASTIPHFIQLIFVIVLIKGVLAAKITYRESLLMSNIDSLSWGHGGDLEM